MRIDVERAIHMDMDVSFYTPRGELIKTLRPIRPNWWVSVPHNKVSLEYDRLQVRVRNYSKFNRDVRFHLLDPVDAVKGTPIPGPRDVDI
jgi:hypothetical protein